MTENRPPLERRRSSLLWVAAPLLIVAVGGGWFFGRLRQPPALTADKQAAAAPSTSRGEVLFQMHCASCHGPEGHGDGAASATLRPPPRDFAVRPWRFDATQSSIRRVVLDGIPGTAMPAARATLAEADVDAVVEHVYRLATEQAPIVREPSPDEILLREAGFVDLGGSAPPPLRLIDSNGNRVKLADFDGKLVLVHFWGTACPHCLTEIINLRKLELEWAERPFKVLHVCADADDAGEAQKALDHLSPGLRALTDETGVDLARYDVHALPAAYLINADGKAVGRSQGEKDWSAPALRRLLERWLKTASPRKQ